VSSTHPSPAPSTTPEPAESERIDGRTARSQRTRRAIVDALRALHADGDLRPTAPRVAERAGVSLRTVWQHFDDLESLFVEGGRRDVEIARAFVEDVDPSAPLPDRVRQVARQRARMFETVAPTWRAARLQEPFSPQIRANRDQLFELGRSHLRAAFSPELDRRPRGDRERVLDALHVVTSWPTWESLRTDLNLDPAAAQATVVRIVTALLADEESA
jgi:TetR/AcrR family transcriptional regulator of autoinduction and epiphytic fitness